MRMSAVVVGLALVLGGCQPVVGDDGALIDGQVEQDVVEQLLEVHVVEQLPEYEPWSVDIERKTLSRLAVMRVAEFVDDRTNTATPFTVNLFIDPAIPSDRHQYFRDVIEQSLAPLGEYFPEGVFAVLGTRTNFLMETIETEGLPVTLGNPNTEYCIPSGWCSWLGGVWGNGGLRVDSYDGTRAQYPMTILHKFVHVMQDNLFPELGGQIPLRSSDKFQPVWFIEGTAEFYSRAILDVLGLFEYQRLNAWAINLREVEQWDGTGRHYEEGQFALELLVASVGFQAVLEIHQLLSDGVGFEDAFEQVAGISLEEFYDLAESFDLRPAHRR